MNKIQKFTMKFFNNKYVVFSLCAASAAMSARYLYTKGVSDGMLDMYNTVNGTKITTNEFINEMFENK